MTCQSCTVNCRFDLSCMACCVRLVASCRSVRAPSVARTQQNAMLALIERHRGTHDRQRVIDALRAGERAA